MEKIAKIDLMVIMLVSLVSAALYVFLGGLIMDYGREPSNPLILRFMPVLMIQFGMSVLGILIRSEWECVRVFLGPKDDREVRC